MIASRSKMGMVFILSATAAARAATALAEVAPDALARANVVVTEPNPLDALLISLGGEAGAAALGGAGVAVQALLKVASTSGAFDRIPGIAKLGIVTALSLLLGPAALVGVGGIGLGTAAIHSTALAAVMVFLNQVGQQTKKARDYDPRTKDMRIEPPT